MAGRRLSKNRTHQGNPDFGTKFKGTNTGPKRKSPLAPNEADAVVLAGQAAKKLGDEHPLVRDCMRVLIGISNNERGFGGRHCAARLRAVVEILDRVVGTPTANPNKGGSHDGVPSWTFTRAPEVGLADVELPIRDVDDEDEP